MTTLMTSPIVDSKESMNLTTDQTVLQTTCPWCQGEGRLNRVSAEGIPSRSFCTHCNGEGVLASQPVAHSSVIEIAGWLIIDLEMPNVVARDLDVVINDRMVTIKSLPRVDAPSTPVQIARDRMPQTAERVIQLPHPVDFERSEAIKANLLDGMLRIVLPTQRIDQQVNSDAVAS